MIKIYGFFYGIMLFNIYSVTCIVICYKPSAAPVIHALRFIGYNPSTAVADLVDNSLDAKASVININFEYNESDGIITITNNGTGMNEEMLQTAMNIGSKDPLAKRGANELGRFGGLKTVNKCLSPPLTVRCKVNM